MRKRAVVRFDATKRFDFEIGLGCVGVTPGVVDTPDTIVARVRAALEHLDPSRVTLNPDCGFAPGSGAEVSLDEVYVKISNEVAAAQALRAEYAQRRNSPILK